MTVEFKPDYIHKKQGRYINPEHDCKLRTWEDRAVGNIHFNNCAIDNQHNETITISTRIDKDRINSLRDLKRKEGFRHASVIRQGIELRILYNFSEYKKLISHSEDIKNILKKYPEIKNIPN